MLVIRLGYSYPPQPPTLEKISHSANLREFQSYIKNKNAM